ncbi:MAG: hypothetical protein QOD77_394 [Thermoplasmata archaeon]|nr:hypothetical protein [Thermoplasmata archaeon]
MPLPPALPGPPRRLVFPLPFALATANGWLFPGRRPALLDCGLGDAATRRVLVDGGVRPEGLTLLVSHGHVDHAGNAAWLARQGAVLHAPPAESRFLETFRADSVRRNDAFAQAMARHGTPPDVVARVRTEGAEIDQWLEDTPIARPIRDGEVLEVGDGEAKVHLAPGHTPGSMLLETGDNELLSGDTLLEHITSNAIELLDADRGRYRQYLETLRGLRRFAGCRVLPGHHEPFVLTDELLDGHLAKHARRQGRVLAGLERPASAWELLPKVLPHLAQDQVFLGMCEVVGHLHALELDGKCRAVGGDPLRFVRDA